MNRPMNPIFRFVLFIIGIILLQRGLMWALTKLGFSGLALIIIFELIMAFVFAWLHYPSYNRKYCFKDPKFHRNVAIFFGIFIIMQLVF